MKRFEINKDDWDKIVKASEEARNTPCFGLSSEQVLSGNDFASMARKRVMDLWKEIGEKYGVVWDTITPIDEENRMVEAEELPTNGKAMGK